MLQEKIRQNIRTGEFKQSEICKVLQLSKGTVSKKANGSLEFSIEEAEKIIEHYNYEIEIKEKDGKIRKIQDMIREDAKKITELLEEKNKRIKELEEELKEYKKICHNEVAECLSKFV